MLLYVLRGAINESEISENVIMTITMCPVTLTCWPPRAPPRQERVTGRWEQGRGTCPS